MTKKAKPQKTGTQTGEGLPTTTAVIAARLKERGLRPQVRRTAPLDEENAAPVLFAWEDKKKQTPPKHWAEANRTTGGALSAMWRRGEFRGKGETVRFVPTGTGGLFVAGLGTREKFRAETVRGLGGRLLKAVAAAKLRRVAVDGGFLAAAAATAKNFLPQKALPAKSDGETERIAAAARAFIEGAALAAYSFKTFKSTSGNEAEGESEGDDLKTAAVKFVWCDPVAARARRVEKEISFAAEVARWTTVARDLQNLPGNCLSPRMLADIARLLARATGLCCTILDEKKIRTLGMGALTAVGKGSTEPPRFIILEYRPTRLSRGRRAKENGPSVVVGKGITFDSGGISLKRGAGMDEMKFDMTGAATTLAAVAAAASLKLPAPVVGIVAAAENMPSGNAQKPGDVCRALNGKTIEVANTDAEGRLVLADALSYATRFKPAAVVDLATLTGAVVSALGHRRTGLFCNDDGLAEELSAAGERTGEKLWPFPLDDEYRQAVRGSTADLRNIGDGTASSIAGAIFLREFTDYPWAHLDVAGTAWKVERPYFDSKFGTGVGVRLLLDWFRRRA